MKMKKLALSFLVIGVLVSVIAQEELPSPGITPDHPLYALDRAIESLQKAFSFTPEAKARFALKLAEERLAETKAMIDNGELDLARKTTEDYEAEMTEAREYGKTIAELAKKKEFDTLVAEATSIHIDVLEKVLEKVPAQAKPAIQKAINVSRRGREESLEDLEEVVPEEVARIRFEFAEKRLKKAKEKVGEREAECSLRCREECEEKLTTCITECVQAECDANETCIAEARDRCERACIGECVSDCMINCTQAIIAEVEDLIEEYELEVNKSSEMREKAKLAGKNITELLELVSSSTSKHLQILQELSKKLPEEAQPAMERVMKVSAIGQEKALEALEKTEPEKAEQIKEELPEEVKEIREKVGIPETPRGRP